MKRNHLLIIACFSIFQTFAQTNFVLNEKYWMTNGPVFALAEKDQTLYLGGAFSYVGPVTGSAGIVDVDGEYIPGLGILNGAVMTIVEDGSGGWFIGGHFTKIDDINMPYLAHIHADGSLDESFEALPSGVVNELYRYDNQLFVAGNFSSIGGSSRNRFAAFDLTDFTLTDLKVEALSGFLRSDILRMLVVDNHLYLGGTFSHVNGILRQTLASIDLQTGALTDWNPLVVGLGTIRIYSMATDGNRLFVGGWFKSVDGQDRQNLASFDLEDGTLNDWNVSTDTYIWDMLVYEDKLYLGGDFAVINDQPQKALAVVDPQSGIVENWEAFSGNTFNNRVFDLEEHNGQLYVAGAFTRIGDIKKNNLAAFDLATGEMTDWKASTSTTSKVIKYSEGQLLVGGGFQSIGGVDRLALAAIDTETGAATPWALDLGFGSRYIESLLFTEDLLYIGGSFETIGQVERTNLAAYDFNEHIITDFSPEITSLDISIPSVSHILQLEPGILIIGGEFDQINGIDQGRLAMLNEHNGTSLDWNPALNGELHAMDLFYNTLFIGGAFTEVFENPRNGLAMISMHTGQLTEFAPEILRECSINFPTGGNCGFTGPVQGDTLIPGQVNALAAIGDHLYFSGSWTEIDGQEQPPTIAFDLVTLQIIDWNKLWGVGQFYKKGEDLYALGSLTENLEPFERYPLAQIDPVSQEVELFSWANANASNNAMLVSDDLLVIGGGISIQQDQALRNYGVFTLDAINQPEPDPVIIPRATASVYPNPGNGAFFLNVDGFPSNILDMELYDLTGRKLWQRKARFAIEKGIPLNLEFLNAGIYVLQIRSGGEAKTVKVVKH